MDDELRPDRLDEAEHLLAVADVLVVGGEVLRRRDQTVQVRRRVSGLAEEIAAHVVVDAVYLPAARVEVLDHRGADQAARSGDQGGLRTHPSSLIGYRRHPMRVLVTG